MKKCKFVFDLDATVLQVIEVNVEKTLELLNRKFGNEFVERHSINASGYLHMVFPGFYELFKWLKDNGHEIIFYSSGIKERNEEAVKKIMEKSIGKYDNERVFSREDLFNAEYMRNTDEDKDEVKKVIGIYYGNKKKKLEGKVVGSKELPYTILIDDDISYSYGGEEKNFLIVAWSSYYYNGDIYREMEQYFSFNKSFYIAGLIDATLKEMINNNKPLVDCLFQLQVLNTGQDFNKNFYFPLRQNREYYEKGLEILKQINLNLTLYFDNELE